MFVAVVCDFAQEDHRAAAHELFLQYGLKVVMTNLYESSTIKENTLARLKRDIDRATDYYDSIRFYQFPLEETFVVTSLSRKKWRRTLVNP